MKPNIQFLLSVAALIAATGPAAADDAQGWSGIYGGITVGVGTAGITGVQDGFGFDPGDDPDNLDPHGAVVGVAVGMLREAQGGLVLGVEADASASNVGDLQFSDSEAIPNQSDIDLNGLASLRARAGYAPGDVLWFMTAGLAYADATYTMRDPGAPIPQGSADLSGFGAVLGLGAEYRLSDGVHFQLQLLHYLFDQRVATSALTSDSDAVDFVEMEDVTTLRAGLMFRF